MASKKYTWLSITDKLPMQIDIVLDIQRYAVRPGTPTFSKVVHNYSTDLQTRWINSFGSKHVLSLRHVKKNVRELMEDYYNNVNLHRKFICYR
jgi:hypothetical protein